MDELLGTSWTCDLEHAPESADMLAWVDRWVAELVETAAPAAHRATAKDGEDEDWPLSA